MIGVSPWVWGWWRLFFQRPLWKSESRFRFEAASHPLAWNRQLESHRRLKAGIRRFQGQSLLWGTLLKHRRVQLQFGAGGKLDLLLRRAEFGSLPISSYFLFHLVHLDPHILQVLSPLWDDLLHGEHFIFFLMVRGALLLQDLVEWFCVDGGRLLVVLTVFVRIRLFRWVWSFEHAIIFTSDLLRLLDEADELSLGGIFLDLGGDWELLVLLCERWCLHLLLVNTIVVFLDLGSIHWFVHLRCWLSGHELGSLGFGFLRDLFIKTGIPWACSLWVEATLVQLEFVRWISWILIERLNTINRHFLDLVNVLQVLGVNNKLLLLGKLRVCGALLLRSYFFETLNFKFRKILRVIIKNWQPLRIILVVLWRRNNISAIWESFFRRKMLDELIFDILFSLLECQIRKIITFIAFHILGSQTMRGALILLKLSKLWLAVFAWWFGLFRGRHHLLDGVHPLFLADVDIVEVSILLLKIKYLFFANIHLRIKSLNLLQLCFNHFFLFQ